MTVIGGWLDHVKDISNYRVIGSTVSDEIIADYVSCSSHNATMNLAADATSAKTNDVMSRDNKSASRQTIYHCDDLISRVGTLPLLLPPATDVDLRLISGLWPSWLESVDSYRRCQLSYAVYDWRMLLALEAQNVSADIELPMTNHDVSADTGDGTMLDRSSRRFHPYLH